jgi:hypothetical protein
MTAISRTGAPTAANASHLSVTYCPIARPAHANSDNEALISYNRILRLLWGRDVVKITGKCRMWDETPLEASIPTKLIAIPG